MTHLPIRPLSRPAALLGTTNGNLPTKLLRATPGINNTPAVVLEQTAARAWRALVFNADIAGHKLAISHTPNAYRPYSVQERIFRQRYTTTPNGTRPKRWNGRLWYKKPGVAVAATPGFSNHGWGLAVDVGEAGMAGVHSLDENTLNWLVDNAHRYGWSWELQSEPWHIRYVAGDRIPPAVLAHEAPARPPIPDDEDDMKLRTLVDTETGEAWVVDNGKARKLSVPGAWLDSFDGEVIKAAGMRHVVADLYQTVS